MMKDTTLKKYKEYNGKIFGNFLVIDIDLKVNILTVEQELAENIKPTEIVEAAYNVLLRGKKYPKFIEVKFQDGTLREYELQGPEQIKESEA